MSSTFGCRAFARVGLGRDGRDIAASCGTGVEVRGELCPDGTLVGPGREVDSIGGVAVAEGKRDGRASGAAQPVTVPTVAALTAKIR
jgi:hypothetical protein